MTDFEQLYLSKVTTAEKLAERVENGWTLGLDAGPAQTPGIIHAITQRAAKDEIKGLNIHTILDIYPYDFYLDKSFAGKINGYSWFSGASARKAVNGGWADVIPFYCCDLNNIISDRYEFDAYCVSVSPMDKHGYFSLGLTNACSEAMREKSKRVFVEVNENQPRAVCGGLIHVSQVDAIVENNTKMPVIERPVLDETSIAIGNLIAEQIPDGACIQLDIGAIPDAMGLALKSKHDLGIHTEFFTDSMVELIECGAVNNSKKKIHRFKSVTTVAFGSQRLYDFVDDNPAIEILPISYVNDPDIISQNDNVVSVNAALEVDLWGQVCAESVGTKHVSGTGGQVDFVRGAYKSRGGQSIIAFESTSRDGRTSRIRSTLSTGAVCTTSKNEVDCIVTEYGIARMHGRSLSERARQLIAIAHPDFRDELTFEAKKRGIMI